MPIRLLIVALLWLSYALLLGHDLLPHHHHDDHDGAVVHHHHASDQDHPHDSDADEPESDWWFAHQHAPGLTQFSSSAPEQYQAPVVAPVALPDLVRFLILPHWPGQTVGWPPTQAKAPPDQYRYRPLRAPPFSSTIA